MQKERRKRITEKQKHQQNGGRESFAENDDWFAIRMDVVDWSSLLLSCTQEKTNDCHVIRMNATSWKQSAGCLFSNPIS